MKKYKLIHEFEYGGCCDVTEEIFHCKQMANMKMIEMMNGNLGGKHKFKIVEVAYENL